MLRGHIVSVSPSHAVVHKYMDKAVDINYYDIMSENYIHESRLVKELKQLKSVGVIA